MGTAHFDRPVSKSYSLRLLGDQLAVCRLAPEGEIPEWIHTGDLVSITRTPAELSIVCPQQVVPEGVQVERDWRAFEVIGPLDFSLVGVLATLASVLAEAGVSIFALSTYDTDYLLVKEAQLKRAASALIAAGHALEA